MTPRDIIQKKRDGGSLSDDEIAYFIRGYMSGAIADYHVTALLMAIYLRTMTIQETIALTREIIHSGATLDLSSIPGKKIDKHSSGGVGDKTSLIVVPIVAACGVTVPMIAGHALGHTGGTLDKLQAIPGFDPFPSPATILDMLRHQGAVIMGQTDDLAPADRRLYALRDVTSTVESIPLITSSILGKKLAEGIDGLVMDVKTGSGAFMPEVRQSRELARSIVDVCHAMKTKVVVVMSDMEQPLGRAVGNAIEVREAIDFLNGDGPEDLELLCLTLAAHMIHLGGRARRIDQARKMAYEAVSNGAAAKQFGAIIRAQGGDDRVMDNPELLTLASNVMNVPAMAHGFVTRCDAKLLGLASNALGASRNRVEDQIDLTVGLYLEKKVGDRVEPGETLYRVYWNNEERLQRAMEIMKDAYEVQARTLKRQPLIHAVLGGSGQL
jgi:pyrimidine-nucleoside phosphorylase